MTAITAIPENTQHCAQNYAEIAKLALERSSDLLTGSPIELGEWSFAALTVMRMDVRRTGPVGDGDLDSTGPLEALRYILNGGALGDQ